MPGKLTASPPTRLACLCLLYDHCSSVVLKCKELFCKTNIVAQDFFSKTEIKISAQKSKWVSVDRFFECTGTGMFLGHTHLVNLNMGVAL